MAERSRSELELICRSALAVASPLFRDAEVSASFYPYIGLTHTIRRKGAAWVVRVSDHLRDAPRAALEAVAALLASKVARRRSPRRALEVYERYRREPAIEARVLERRRQRGRKVIDASGGEFHSLESIFRELSARCFNNQVEVTRLGWGRRSWTRLGHYDPAHHTITISRILDSPRVPRRAVAAILYHEMLHALFESSRGCGRGRDHPPEFRRAERAYPDFALAREFLAEYCRRGRRRGHRPRAPRARARRTVRRSPVLE